MSPPWKLFYQKNLNFLILQNKGKCRVPKYMKPSILMCDDDTWDNDEL
jgi:hypothetical protein